MKMEKPTGSLISEALAHMSALVRKEIDLAKAEINRGISKAGSGAAMLAVAAIVALAALNALTAALVAWLGAMGLEFGWASLAVGVGLLLIALVLLRVGIGRLKAASLAPSRAVENVKKDAAAVKGAIE